MRNKGLCFQITATYVGTVIGAGFASGQEIIQFFTHLGFPGFWGIGLATILFAFFGFLILFLAEQIQAYSYGELIQNICGKRIGIAMDFSITLFLLGGLCVMLAGGGAIFAEHLGLPYTIGVISTSLIVMGTVIFGTEGVMLANAVIVPIMVGVTLLVNLLVAGEKGFHWHISPMVDPPNSNSWLLSTFLYVAYNMTLAVGVLASLGRGVKEQRPVYWGGIMGGLVLGGLILLNNLSLTAYYPQAISYQVPMLYIASHYGSILQFSYVLVLWLEMITTAIGNVYGFARKIELVSRWNYKVIVIVSVLLAIPFSYWGFAHLVSFLYPLFGYLSLAFLLFLFFAFLRSFFFPFLTKRKD